MGQGPATDNASAQQRPTLFRRAADLTWLLLSFILRLAAGMAVLVLLARLLGREAFGQFAYSLALATLFAVPANFGLATFVLREIGIDRGRFGPTLAAALTTKLVIAAAVVLAASGMAALLSPELRLPFLLLVLAQLADSFAELFNLGFRPGGHYPLEARLAVATSALHLALMASVLALPEPSAAAAAALFCLSRLLGCAWTWLRTRRLEAPYRLAPLSAVPGLLRRCWAYAAELFQLTAYAQIDSVFIKHFLSIVDVGVYQAGMKLVEGGARLAPVFAQYALPTLTRHVIAGPRAHGLWRPLAGFALIGALGGGCLALGADLIVEHLYGAQYQPLHTLLPLFGLMLLLRYLETGTGVAVVAAGWQHVKVWFVSFQLLLMLGLGPWAMRHWGLPGWQWVVVGTLALAVVGNLLLFCCARWLPEAARAHRASIEAAAPAHTTD